MIPSVLDALAKVGATNAAEVLTARLKADDPVVRGGRRPGSGDDQGAECDGGADRGLQDRAARRALCRADRALDALTALDPAAARAVLTSALADRDWAVRRACRRELRKLDRAADVSSMRPAPPPSVPELAARR